MRSKIVLIVSAVLLSACPANPSKDPQLRQSNDCSRLEGLQWLVEDVDGPLAWPHAHDGTARDIDQIFREQMVIRFRASGRVVVEAAATQEAKNALQSQWDTLSDIRCSEIVFSNGDIVPLYHAVGSFEGAQGRHEHSIRGVAAICTDGTAMEIHIDDPTARTAGMTQSPFCVDGQPTFTDLMTHGGRVHAKAN